MGSFPRFPIRKSRQTNASLALLVFTFFSGGAAPVGCECVLLDADCAETEAPAGGKASRQNEKGMEEELPERTALVHRLRDHVSRVKSFLKRADNVYSDGLYFRSVSQRPLFMCSNFRKFPQFSRPGSSEGSTH